MNTPYGIVSSLHHYFHPLIIDVRLPEYLNEAIMLWEIKDMSYRNITKITDSNAMPEKLSAWMDSELSDAQTRLLLPELMCDAKLRDKFFCYHLIRNTLRGVQEHSQEHSGSEHSGSE